jgi:hypothetical protein
MRSVITHVIFALAILTVLTGGSALADQQCIKPDAGSPLPDGDAKAVVFTTRDNSSVFKKADFSLPKTLDNILKTARGDMSAPISATEREALLDTLLESLKQETLTNDDSGLTFPVIRQPGFDTLSAKDLLKVDGPDEMLPVGLFNRLDQTPQDMSNCGEYRIVYAKNNGGGFNRFFLIFEAALPNPDPGNVEGCRQVAKLWDGFRSASDDQIATALNDFYYKGGPVAGGSLKFEPVVHVDHYGCPNGQVRANSFVSPGGNPFTGPWILRQWRTKVPETGGVIFQSRPVKDNPVPDFFDEHMSSITPSEVFAKLRGEFQDKFVGAYASKLVEVDATAKPSAPVSGGDLIDKLGIHVDARFNAMESKSGSQTRGGSAPPKTNRDDPNNRAGAALRAKIAKTLSDAKLDSCGITPDHVINRMGALTCGGCHQFSNGKEIAPGVNWPNSNGFVQIREDGTLSDLLTQRFLPFRFAIVEKFAGGVTPFATSAAEMSALAPTNRGKRAELARLLDSAREGGLQSFAEQPKSASAKVVDIAKIDQLCTEVRKFDAAQPGAFVLRRKPD